MSVVLRSPEALSYMSDSGPITISEESVRAESEEIVAMARELSARQLRFAKLLEFLRAMGREEWIPAGVDRIVPPLQSAHRGAAAPSPGTWASEILRELEAFPDGIAQLELLEVMKKGPLAARAEQNPNGLYNASSKLEAAGEIVKHKGRIFLPHLFGEFRKRVERGEVEDVTLRHGKKTSADTLSEFINSQPQGVEAGDIVKEMSARGMSAGVVYNNLSKIVAKNRVRREGKTYLPLNSEAPPAKAEGAFDFTGREGGTSPSNMGSGNG